MLAGSGTGFCTGWWSGRYWPGTITPMALPLTRRNVLSVTEARKALPQLARSFRGRSSDTGIVFFGSHRRADAAIVPAALIEKLEPYLEDLLIAERVRARSAAREGTLTLEELDERLGLDPADVEAAKSEILAELDG